MMQDHEVMLIALSKERDLLHEQLMQVDRIIKKIKTGEYLAPTEAITMDITPVKHIEQSNSFPVQANIKIQVLMIFDQLGQAAKLKDVQTAYTRHTGKNFNLRESMRSLHNSKLLYNVKEKDANRSILWVKSEWIDNGQLLDKFKPEGFDLLYKADNIEFV